MWLYNNKEFTSEMIGENYGFVYHIINNVNGRIYVGKKFFWSKRTLKPLKGKTRKRHVVKESDWQRYWSSSKIVTHEIDEFGKEYFTRRIVSLHPNKSETNLAELSEQIILNVLEARDEYGDRIFYNENIERKYYPSKKFDTHRLDNHKERLDRATSIFLTDTP